MSQLSLTSRSGRPGIPAGVQAAASQVADWLNAHSITVLRVSLGLVFCLFGALKFVPGLSPAEDLAIATIDRLTFGIVSGGAALMLTAVTETFIGLTMVTGRFLRSGLVVLGGALVGIMSPLVIFAGELFGNGPTLEAQYVIKDIVLAAAGLAVAGRVLSKSLDREGRAHV
ncbi:DoxX family protein [Actinopolymorpha sp. B17G11]|uniref:DoxX family protein n=1 Tax=unclassified Actinopolymorpha TaxID=2627063 RepID=UPI0032D8C6EE